MHKLPKPRVRGTEDLRPKSDGRRAEKVTRARTIAHWPTAMLAALDEPIGFRPSSPKGGAR